MGQQTEQQNKWKLEKSLTPGQAPYVPPNKRGMPVGAARAAGGGKAQTPSALQKRLKAEEAKNKQLQQQLKGGGGGGRPAQVKPPPVSAEVKALQEKLARFKGALEAAPENNG